MRNKLPVEAFSSQKRRQVCVIGAHMIGNHNLLSFQHNLPFIQRKAVKTRPVFRGERLERVEGAFLFKDRSVAFERERRVENAGAAAGGFLCRPCIL